MRITRLSWTNYKGLEDGAIEADGSDVIVRGQNGVGKSTIAETISFILFGKIEGTIKRYEGGRVQHATELIHGAEVVFDDGTSLRREVEWNGGNDYYYYINGESVSATKFEARVCELTNNGRKLVINPFFFHDDKKFPKTKRREMLIKLFGDVDERDILTGEESEMLCGLSVDKFLDETHRRLKKLKMDKGKIPERIDENERKLETMPADLPKAIAQLEEEIARLESQEATLQVERDKLNQPLPTNLAEQYCILTEQLDDLRKVQGRIKCERDEKENKRANLRNNYREVKNAEPGRCPTCGQEMQPEKFAKLRNEKLAEIVAEGQRLSTAIRDLDVEIKKADEKITAIEDKAKRIFNEAHEQTANEVKRKESLAEMDKKLREVRTAQKDLREALTEYKSATETSERIAELQSELKALSKEIVRLEGHIESAKLIRQRRIELLEEKINSAFDSVKIKMFNVKLDGEATETCEAFMHDVPYSALSKGEKLKCALEIFKVIQNYYGVELPVFIDDAESYTLNSFVKLPNQKWLFKVSDEEKLTIEVKKASVAA